jgi:hypothetical protein
MGYSLYDCYKRDEPLTGEPMNDPNLAVAKLKEQVKQAAKADTDHEKAAIYAAARWLLADLQAESDKQSLCSGEGILRVRDAIAAMTGFDDLGRPFDALYPDGMHGIKSLEENLKRRQP